MKLFNIYTATLMIAFFLSACSSTKKVVEQKQELTAVDVLQSLQLTNRYFMNKWTDTGKPIYTNRWRPSNIWTRAVYYEGLMALYQIDKNNEYYNYAVEMPTTKLVGRPIWISMKLKRSLSVSKRLKLI